MRSAMPTSSTTVAISQTRPRVVAAMIPIARWRLPAFSASCGAALGEPLDTALGEPGDGRRGVPEQREIRQDKDNRGCGQHQ